MIHSIYQSVYRQVFLKKLYSPLGAILLGLFTIIFSVFMVKTNNVLGPLVIGMLGALILFIVCLILPIFGFYIATFISCFAFYPDRILGFNIPLSVGIEFLILGVYLGVLLQNRRKAASNVAPFYRAPSSIIMMFFFIFILIEGFNPNMYSLTGWFFYVRRFIEFFLIYYSAYRLIDTTDKIKFFIKFWIAIAIMNAIYTCKQQWFGFFAFEETWLRDNPHLIALYLQGGVFRKFSFLSDPAANGIWMSSMAVFVVTLGLWANKRKTAILLFLISVLMLLAMAYTGTRTAIAILPGGFIFYILMTLNNKTTFTFFIYGLLIIGFILFAPIDNKTLNRIRSSFHTTQNDSYQVRNINRKKIQPYIYAHPMGGGLATSSSEGMQYNPGHPLAGFPPDSGFLKSAIETGWIGYAVSLIYFIVLIFQGTSYYFKAQDKVIRSYILAFTASLLVYVIAQYSQVAIGQFPTLFFFYSAASLLIRLYQLDKQIQTAIPKMI